MSITFNDATRALLDNPNYAVVSTINPDGAPQSSVVWVKRDGDDVLFSTVRGRRKEKNLARDPRISLTIFSQENPYDYVEIRGTTSMTELNGRELINELSNKYGGNDYPEEPAGTVRVVVRITAEKVVGFSA